MSPSSKNPIRLSLYIVLAIAALCSLGLVAKSMIDFSRSGPEIAEEVTRSYLWYSIVALTRLGLWVFAIIAFMAASGVFVYHCLLMVFRWRYRGLFAMAAAGLAVGVVTTLRFSQYLLYLPGGLVASFSYRVNRLYPLWERLTPEIISVMEWVVALSFLVPPSVAIMVLARRGNRRDSAIVAGILSAAILVLVWAGWKAEPAPVAPGSSAGDRPNIVMIGSDTLRADRLGVNGYGRALTPNIDTLSEKGINFSRCIIPLARTAPSLLSLLTGTWPHTHGVRDNYVGDVELKPFEFALPRLLAQAGYRTAVLGDWAASDLGKFDLGFQEVDTSPDQWNLKYLLRQGPKDIRLFLSLFTNNRFGKYFLPEVYYLAGMPLTAQVGRDARVKIQSLTESGKPFFLNVFIASTHGPFSTTYPYYRMFADPQYRGDSLFSMSAVASVEEVLKAQEAGKEHFDVRQIKDIYDGAVKSFDDEVGRILGYLKASGLDQNTIIVIYSDHGVDLFEGETWGQGNIVSDFSYRVPLVIYDPRRPGGVTVGKTVRSVDVAPTLLELAGVPIPDTMEGISLVPFWEHGNEMPDRVAFAETGIWIAKVRGLPQDRIYYPSVLNLLDIPDKKTGTLALKKDYVETIIRAKSRLAREGDWALVYFPLQHGESFSLYDLKDDLAMRHDIASQNPEMTERLKKALLDWMRKD